MVYTRCSYEPERLKKKTRRRPQELRDGHKPGVLLLPAWQSRRGHYSPVCLGRGSLQPLVSTTRPYLSSSLRCSCTSQPTSAGNLETRQRSLGLAQSHDAVDCVDSEGSLSGSSRLQILYEYCWVLLGNATRTCFSCSYALAVSYPNQLEGSRPIEARQWQVA